MINIIKIKKILKFQKVNGGLKLSTFIIFQLFINFAIKEPLILYFYLEHNYIKRQNCFVV